jgi:hypothetical protein
MTAIQYAAIFAEDLALNDDVRETLGYTDGIAALSELVGTVMETQNNLSRGQAQDFWPVAGAEAAAAFVNNAPADLQPEEIIASTIGTALVAGFTEGR